MRRCSSPAPAPPRRTRGVRAGSAVLLTLAVVACAPEVERTEVLRVPAPDGTLDAVVVQQSAGATTSYGYTLSLPVHGCAALPAPSLRVDGATRSASAWGVSVSWLGPRTVRLSWLDARARDPDQDSLRTVTARGAVTVLSGGGVPAPTAPPGAMTATPAATDPGC